MDGRSRRSPAHKRNRKVELRDDGRTRLPFAGAWKRWRHQGDGGRRQTEAVVVRRHIEAMTAEMQCKHWPTSISLLRSARYAYENFTAYM